MFRTHAVVALAIAVILAAAPPMRAREASFGRRMTQVRTLRGVDQPGYDYQVKALRDLYETEISTIRWAAGGRPIREWFQADSPRAAEQELVRKVYAWLVEEHPRARNVPGLASQPAVGNMSAERRLDLVADMARWALVEVALGRAPADMRADFARGGVEPPGALSKYADRWQSLRQVAAGAVTGPAAVPLDEIERWADQQRPLRRKLARALLVARGVDSAVFAVREQSPDWHWYCNFGYRANNPGRKYYGARGKLSVIDLNSGEVTDLVDDQMGAVRDPAVHYDGRTILYSYRKGGEDNYNLYEIQADGSGERRVTHHKYDDIEPCYLPDDDIMFCSSRCKRFVPCWHSPVAILYRSDRDGENVQLVSPNVEHDNAPWMMPDGRVIYTRWEYVDRSQVEFHHLWTFNPDGTGVMTYFGNMHPGFLMIDAKPLGQAGDVVCIFGPGHGPNEHHGEVRVVSPKAGPDREGKADRISNYERRPRYGYHKYPHRWRDPYPVGEDLFLVAREREMVLMDRDGYYEPVYALPDDVPDRLGGNQPIMVHEPRPLVPREREPLVVDRTDPSREAGRMILSDVYRGRRMEGVEPGTIKKLMVLEVMPKPVNFSGIQFPMTISYKQWGTYFIYRVLGTVPVEEDGSAHFEVPALRSIFFVALDENDRSVKRMHSFTNAMPGEVISCVGCHEKRSQSGHNPASPALQALRRPASPIEPIAGTPDTFDFPRDVQPILDKHCVKCHNDDKLAARMSLEGTPGPWYSHAYANLMLRMEIGHGGCQGNFLPRRTGSSYSPLMKRLEPEHHDVQMSKREKAVIRTWIDAGAPWPGTYAALGSGLLNLKLPGELVKKRCYSCHSRERGAGMRNGGEMPPSYFDDFENTLAFPSYTTGAQRLPDSYFNLAEPEKSLWLRAPLAKDAGGLGLCTRTMDGEERPAPFADTDDEGYRELLAPIEQSGRELKRIKRFHMPGFRPNEHWVREMVRYGLLPPEFDLQSDDVDVYEVEERYWQSFYPEAKSGGSTPDGH